MKLKMIVTLISFCLMLLSGSQTTHAVLAPDIQAEIDRKLDIHIDKARKHAPEVVDIHVSAVERHGRWYVVTARVQDVVRSEHGIKINDLITIKYMDISAAARRHNDELTTRPTPGPGFIAVLPLLEKNDTMRAWLTNHPKNSGTFTLAADIGSFANVSGQGKHGDPCEDNPMGPFTSQLKACATQKYQAATHRLEKFLNQIRQSLDSTGTAGNQDDVTVRQQKYLASSMKAWKQYRDDTCRLVYLEHYPGSHARLHDLDCMTRLTEERIRQLREIFSPGKAGE